MEIIVQLRSKERRQSHDTNVYIDVMKSVLFNKLFTTIFNSVSAFMRINLRDGCLSTTRTVLVNWILFYPLLNVGVTCLLYLAHNVPITTAADDRYCDFRELMLIFHVNRLPADDSHQISSLTCPGPESFVRGDPTLTPFFGGLMMGGRIQIPL